MAEGKNKIIVYRDWISTFDAISDEEAGRLIKHFFRYVNDLNPEAPDRLTALLFEPIKQTLKRDLRHYEAICLKNRDNILTRWNTSDTDEYERKGTDTNYTDSDSDSDNDKIDYNNIVDLYHSLCPEMSKILKLTNKRKGFVNARLSEYGIEKITSVFRLAGESDFLNGKSEKYFRADFEWLLRPNNFIKVLEGKYQNKKQALKLQM